jgi:hypothetical protein
MLQYVVWNPTAHLRDSSRQLCERYKAPANVVRASLRDEEKKEKTKSSESDFMQTAAGDGASDSALFEQGSAGLGAFSSNAVAGRSHSGNETSGKVLLQGTAKGDDMMKKCRSFEQLTAFLN